MKKEQGTAVCVTTDCTPCQGGEVQQVELWLLHNARNDPGALGQTAGDREPQGESKAEDWRVLLLDKTTSNFESN